MNDELAKTNEVVADLQERAEASDSLRQAAAKSDAYKAEMDRLREKLGSLGHIEEELKVHELTEDALRTQVRCVLASPLKL